VRDLIFLPDNENQVMMLPYSLPKLLENLIQNQISRCCYPGAADLATPGRDATVWFPARLYICDTSETVPQEPQRT